MTPEPMSQQDRMLYLQVMSQLSNPPCVGPHDYQKFTSADGQWVLAVRCVVCGREPSDELLCRETP